MTTISEEKRLQALKISEYVTSLLKEKDNYMEATAIISTNKEDEFFKRLRDAGIPTEYHQHLWESFKEDEFTAQFW